MNTPKPIEESDLHAYVDGALDEAAGAEVEAWLAAHPEDAARVHAYKLQNTQLHRIFDGVLDEPLPAALTAPAAGRAARSPPLWMRIAAAVALLFIGGAAGWGLHGMQGGRTAAGAQLVRQAVGAHLLYVSEVRHPVEVGADQETHLVAWLSKRLGHALKAPKLTTAGYQLVGGRLLPDEGAPAAQFMYEDTNGRRVTVYVRTNRQGFDTAFRFVGDNAASAFYWTDGPFAYAMIGDMPRDDLLGLARAVYEDLTK